MRVTERLREFFAITLSVLAVLAPCASAQPVEPVWSLAQKEKPALVDTLKELVEIESGSRDIEGLDKIANIIAARLKTLGGKVEPVEPEREDQRWKISKMVRATFTGAETKKILLLAHMDTVYPRGILAQQPFKIEGDRAWGLGIADDRHGIAVILHALAILKTMQFRDYGTVTVLINADEEMGSPASRNLIVRLGLEHDAVKSYESGGGPNTDNLKPAISGAAVARIIVRGRAAESSGT